jgi:uncharacterized membrane protein
LHNRIAASLTVGACVWVAAIVAAPYAISSHNPVLLAAGAMVYEGAGLVCHQRPERSFHVAAVQLPVCGRCFGLYVSAAFGVVIGWFASRRISNRDIRLTLLVAAIPTALTLSLEFIGLIHPTNVVRAVSALPLGGAAAWIFITSLRAET